MLYTIHKFVVGISFLNLGITLGCITLTFFTYTNFTASKINPTLEFILLIFYFGKCVTASFFVAFEYYDIFFEHVYLDVQFILKPIR